MFILTVAGKEREGAYSVQDGAGNQILYLFEQEDDAERYAMMLNDDEKDSELNVIEIDDAVAIMKCKRYNYKYAVITPNDIVIPPKNDNVSKD